MRSPEPITLSADPAIYASGLPDLLIHAAAQLGDRVGVALPVPADPRLTGLAEAYGIGGRVWFGGERGRDGEVISLAGVGERAGGSAGHLRWEIAGRPIGTMAQIVEDFAERSDPPAVGPAPGSLLAGQRVAVVTNIPIHYRLPLFEQLGEELRGVGAELRVLFSAPEGGSSGRPWLRHEEIGFDHRFLDAGARGMWGLHGSRGLESRLREFRPTIVVSGGFAPMVTGRALRYASGEKIPFGVWSGDTHLQTTARSRVRRLERRWIARRSTFGLAYGWLAREHLRGLAPSLPAVIARNSAPFLHDRPPSPGGKPIEVLAVGQAIPRKGLDVAIEAFRLLREQPCRLTIVGGGSALEELRTLADGLPQVRVLGAVDSDRVLNCYREADVFLFPTRSDVFGLVLVEAMGAGVATITSAAPGATADLCVDAHNCLIISDHDPARWAAAIAALVEDADLRHRLAENGRHTIAGRWTIEHSVGAWVAGLRLGLASPRPG